MDWLLLLLLVMCPLMMIFMMKGHGHGGGHHHGNQKVNTESHNHSIQSYTEESSVADYKIKQLEGKIEFLTRQNNDLQSKIDQLTSDK